MRTPFKSSALLIALAGSAIGAAYIAGKPGAPSQPVAEEASNQELSPLQPPLPPPEEPQPIIVQEPEPAPPPVSDTPPPPQPAAKPSEPKARKSNAFRATPRSGHVPATQWPPLIPPDRDAPAPSDAKNSPYGSAPHAPGGPLKELADRLKAGAERMALAQQNARENGYSSQGLFRDFSLGEISFGKAKARLGGEYDTQFGMVGRGDIASLITENTALEVEVAIGPKQREVLLQGGWQFTQKGALRITAHELRQLMEFDFISGKDSAWVKQHTLGGAVRWKLDNHLVEYLEGNGYISKADSLQLSKMTYTIETSSLYELWEDQRRIAGSTTYGGSGGATLRLSPEDTLQLSLGVEQRSRDTQETTGASIRATGGAKWKHTFAAESPLAGLATSIGVARNSGSGVSVEASADRGIGDGNWGMSGFVRWDGLAESGIGGTGADSAATVGLKVSYTFDRSRQKFLDRTAQTADRKPQGERPGNSSAAAFPMVFDLVRERADYNPRRVQASVDETARPIRKISVDKTSLPAGSTIDSSGNATLEAGVALGTIVSAVNTTLGGTAIPTSLFSISGTKLAVNLSSLEPYISGSSSDNRHTLTITTTTSTITMVTYKGSVHIVSVSVSNTSLAASLTDGTHTINEYGTGSTVTYSSSYFDNLVTGGSASYDSIKIISTQSNLKLNGAAVGVGDIIARANLGNLTYSGGSTPGTVTWSWSIVKNGQTGSAQATETINVQNIRYCASNMQSGGAFSAGETRSVTVDLINSGYEGGSNLDNYGINTYGGFVINWFSISSEVMTLSITAPNGPGVINGQIDIMTNDDGDTCSTSFTLTKSP